MDKNFDKKLEEYINLLINDDSFNIKENEQNRTFSNGKKMATFFIDHHEEIVQKLFVNIDYKEKVLYFKARSKIIDYIISHNTKKISSSRDIVLNYLQNKDNIEDIVRCVSISMVNGASHLYKDAFYNYMEYYNYNHDDEFDIQDHMNSSARDYAMASEKFLKSCLIFSECRKAEKYIYSPKELSELNKWRSKNKKNKKIIVGSSEWRQELNKNGDYGDIRSEISLLMLIKDNIINDITQKTSQYLPAGYHDVPNIDSRFYITNDEIKTTSGHNLYSLYKFLDPIDKIIINSEFYIYDTQNPINERKSIGMLAILTENIQYDQAGTNNIIKDLQSYSDDFIKARYADIDLNNIKPDELEFLKQLTTALKGYCEYKFPLRKKHDKIDFTSVDIEVLNIMEQVIYDRGKVNFTPKYPYFYKLDKISKYYLLKYFEENEFKNLNDYCKKIYNSDNPIECEQFLNIVIFFKYFFIEKEHKKINFEKNIFDKLHEYYKCIKKFDLFEGKNDNLFLNNFFTEENIERLQKELYLKKNNQLKDRLKRLKELKAIYNQLFCQSKELFTTQVIADVRVRAPKKMIKNEVFHEHPEFSPSTQLELEDIHMKVKKIIWNRMYELAKAYYDHHGNSEIPNKFKTKNGYEYDDEGELLGEWCSRQRSVQEKLSEEQINKLNLIEFRFNIKKEHKDNIIELCNQDNLDIKKYKFLTKMPYQELYAKIAFILDNNYKLEFNGELNPIFEMSDINMQIQYGISKEELITKYYIDKKKRGA